MSKRYSFTWGLFLRFAGEWGLLQYCEDKADAEQALKFWRQRISWRLKIEPLVSEHS